MRADAEGAAPRSARVARELAAPGRTASTAGAKGAAKVMANAAATNATKEPRAKKTMKTQAVKR